MKKIAAASMLSVILVAVALLICAPNKAPEKIVVNENVNNKAALSASTTVPTQSPTANSSQTQQPTSTTGSKQPQSTPHEEGLPLPSPFIVAVFIIGLVAVSGLILSLCLRKRGKREISPSSVPTRVVTVHRKLDD